MSLSAVVESMVISQGLPVTLSMITLNIDTSNMAAQSKQQLGSHNILGQNQKKYTTASYMNPDHTFSSVCWQYVD